MMDEPTYINDMFSSGTVFIDVSDSMVIAVSAPLGHSSNELNLRWSIGLGWNDIKERQ